VGAEFSRWFGSAHPARLPRFFVYLFGSPGDFNEMKPKLRLYRAVDFSKVPAEDNVIKFLDHLARGKLAQLSSALSGGTLGVLPGQFRKIGSGFNLTLDVFTLFLRFNQNVTCCGFGHNYL